ncbi:hypothetical protein EGI16_12310 [Chryseobacterium sp. G0240]|uniref:hypothetical protein n=1 Tax=Chryseobacterium sp. G0240 TaxID=2487066 RepID=UPI000F45209A|nr:hypothetical protein [Chryseobacterium sp. G0240]ROI02946.1 hypothetical protein EGI16_12310 [Chryseobacterium sp. G0240]
MITLNKSSLSLTENIFVPELTGDNKFIAWNDDGTNQILYEYDPIFSLSTDSSVSGEEVTVFIGFGFNLGVGNYEYNIIAKSPNGSVIQNIKIYLKVIDEDTIPEENKPYYLKYQFENEPNPGEIFKCEIHERGYLGSVIDINGKAEHKYQDKTDHFQPIVASNLNLKLLANEDVNLQDLYSENERHFKVYLKREDQVIFIGFLKPDGIWEDYVSDKWELSVEVIDGLSTLKNISFSNENGTSFSGKYSAFEIITNCLLKTGLNIPINVNCNVYYEGWDGGVNTRSLYNILKDVYLNTQRFFQNASDPMDCESVLKSILQLFNASLIQMAGEWYIYRPIDIKEFTHFSKYVNNNYLEDFFLNTKTEIGSHINNYELFHCNSNQKKSISPSVQAYRVVYEYGNANSVYLNSELKLSGSGLDIQGWEVHNVDGKVYRNENGFGLNSKTFTGNSDPLLISLNQSIDINEGAVIKLIIRFSNENINSVGLRFALAIGGKFFNIDEGQWQDSGKINFIANYSFEGWYPDGTKICKGLGDATYELIVKSPISGNLVLSIYRDRHQLGGGDFKINSVNVVPNDSGNIKGREYTAQRTKMISTVVKPNITLYNGDSVSDLFVGTIYKSDGDTPTEYWNRSGVVEEKELLSINAEDNLRIAPRPMIIFEGDIKGYIPFMGLIAINNVAEKVQPTGYLFDTSTGVTKLVLREFSTDYLELEKDYNINVRNNYGNESKVTIV